jgi:hypothetical protein
VHGGAVRNEDELGYRLSLPLAGFSISLSYSVNSDGEHIISLTSKLNLRGFHFGGAGSEQLCLKLQARMIGRVGDAH